MDDMGEEDSSDMKTDEVHRPSLSPVRKVRLAMCFCSGYLCVYVIVGEGEHVLARENVCECVNAECE